LGTFFGHSFGHVSRHFDFCSLFNWVPIDTCYSFLVFPPYAIFFPLFFLSKNDTPVLAVLFLPWTWGLALSPAARRSFSYTPGPFFLLLLETSAVLSVLPPDIGDFAAPWGWGRLPLEPTPPQFYRPSVVYRFGLLNMA